MSRVVSGGFSKVELGGKGSYAVFIFVGYSYATPVLLYFPFVQAKDTSGSGLRTVLRPWKARIPNSSDHGESNRS